MIRAILLVSVLSLLMHAAGAGQASRLSTFDRGVSQTMLKQIKQDLKDNYYDPAFGGVDVDKVFADAEAALRTAETTGQAAAILAETLLRLDDSHTVFYPPERLTKVDYGWSLTMIGDAPLVTFVRKDSDAAAKGLARGDRVLTWNRFEPTRANLWQIRYVYKYVRPQQLQRVVVRTPDGTEKTLDIESTVDARPRGELEDLIREIEDAWRTTSDFEKPHGDILVVSLSHFGEPGDIERFMKKARGYRGLVLDLRGNGGGRVDALNRLISWCFTHDVQIGTEKTRKGSSAEIAKGRKDAFTGRLVVLVDSRSASASEVAARVMQIDKRGAVIGDRTAGAVMTSRFFPHTLGQELGGVGSFAFYATSITVADVRMADGLSLENNGVTPDETRLPTADDLAKRRDPVLARAITLLGGTMTPEEAGRFYQQ